MPQQLFAEIRKDSKYAYQIRHQAPIEYPFPVSIEPEEEGYVVKGGWGGQYRLTDVHLVVLHQDGSKTRIS